MGEGMRKEFLGGVTKEKQAVNAFVASNSENALKTKPKVRTNRAIFALRDEVVISCILSFV